MMPYIIVGAALIVIGVLWLSLYIFTSRKTTVETTDMNPVNATEADIARVEEAQRKLRVNILSCRCRCPLCRLDLGLSVLILSVTYLYLIA